MRFPSTQAPSPRIVSASLRWRLWLLVLLLAGVLWAMNRLGQPEAAATLGRLFLLDNARTVAESPPFFSEDKAESIQGPDGGRGSSPAVNSKSSNIGVPSALAIRAAPTLSFRGGRIGDNQLWEAVRDNAAFRSAEQSAWFRVLDQIQDIDPDSLARESLGEATYAQLLSQPDEYRGRVVAIRGTAIEAVSKTPEANDLGIENYYRVAIAPLGGGRWPLFVYCLRLPDGFPTGDAMRERVDVNGVFFKNWSYAYGDGFGLAPVLLAPTLNWRRPPPPPAVEGRATRTAILLGAAGCAGVAALAVYWVLLQTKRKTHVRETSSAELASLDGIDASKVRTADALQRLSQKDGS